VVESRRQVEPLGRAPHLVQRDEAVIAIEGCVLDPFAITGPESCCNFIAKRSAAVRLNPFAFSASASAVSTCSKKSKAEGCRSGSKRRARDAPCDVATIVFVQRAVEIDVGAVDGKIRDRLA